MFNSKRIRGWFTWKKPAVVAAPTDGASNTVQAGTTGQDSRSREGTTSMPDRHPADRPRRRRRRRREPSPTGLPLYAEEPHDDEMSLFKHDGSSRVDLRDLYSNSQADLDEDHDARSSIYHRPSMDAASALSTHLGRGRSVSDAPSAPGSLYAYPNTPPRQSSDLNTDLRPGLGHRSTQSSSSLSASPSAQMNAGRARSSTLRSIFTRNSTQNDGASVLSSSPGSSSIRGRSPYGQSGQAASASNASINSSRISAPLQHTLVSSSFIFPKSGPTASQLAFISSRENLGAYGYGDGVAQIPTYDHGSSPPLPPSVPSATEPASNSSMAVPVATGRFRASSVSSQLSIVSSPLSRSHSPADSDHEDDSRETGPPIPSYDELHPSPSTSSMPTSTSIPSLSIVLPSELESQDSPHHTPSATPRSHSPALDTPIGQPVLPSLMFSRGTPTSSGLSSPVPANGARGPPNVGAEAVELTAVREGWKAK